MKHFQLTEQEKQDMIKRLTQDVAWSQDEIYANEESESNQDVSNEDEEGLF